MTLIRLSAILALVISTLIIALRYAQKARICATILLSAWIIAACAPATPNLPLSPLPSVTAQAATATVLPSVTASPRPTTAPTRTASPTLSPPPTATRTATPTATASATLTPSATPTLGPTPDGEARNARVPILMYHYVSQPPHGADAYRKDLSVTPERFRQQMQHLKDAGYTVVTLDDLLYALAQGRALPAKPVILTFDDGYRDNYENAFPTLKEFGFRATFFVITDFVTEERPEYMTWPQIEEMAAAGMIFGSHSRNHPNLAGQSVDYLVWQALGSQEAIEVRLGQTPRWVAYPSGKYDARAISVFRSAGFWGGVTTQQGVEHSLEEIFELKRVRVRGSHTAPDLARLLTLEW